MPTRCRAARSAVFWHHAFRGYRAQPIYAGIAFSLGALPRATNQIIVFACRWSLAYCLSSKPQKKISRKVPQAHVRAVVVRVGGHLAGYVVKVRRRAISFSGANGPQMQSRERNDHGAGIRQSSPVPARRRRKAVAQRAVTLGCGQPRYVRPGSIWFPMSVLGLPIEALCAEGKAHRPVPGRRWLRRRARTRTFLPWRCSDAGRIADTLVNELIGAVRSRTLVVCGERGPSNTGQCLWGSVSTFIQPLRRAGW